MCAVRCQAGGITVPGWVVLGWAVACGLGWDSEGRWTGQGRGKPQSLRIGGCGALYITLMGVMVSELTCSCFRASSRHLLCHLGMTMGHSVVSVKTKTEHWIGFLELVSKDNL